MTELVEVQCRTVEHIEREWAFILLLGMLIGCGVTIACGWLIRRAKNRP